VCDINPELMQQTLAAIRSKGGEAEGYPVDVTKKETLAAMVKAVMAKWGASTAWSTTPASSWTRS